MVERVATPGDSAFAGEARIPTSPAWRARLLGAAIVGGLSALGGALSGLGIPKDSVIRYEAAIQADQFVVIAQGTEAEVTRARSILAGASPTTLDEHIAVPA